MGRARQDRGAALTLTLPAALALAGCVGGTAGGTGGVAAADGRPLGKPAALTASVAGPAGPQDARVETARGEILLLSLEGKVVPVSLASPEGRRALGETEAQIARAGVTPAAPGKTRAAETPKLSAQDALVADFESQRVPVLPTPGEGAEKPDPKNYLGARVAELRPDGSRAPAGRKAGTADMQLVEVTATLRQGVDADTAFAYATCALAGWAARSGTPFARHIRTLQQGENGRLTVASVFTVSGVEPMGLKVIEARQTLSECEARGIPAV